MNSISKFLRNIRSLLPYLLLIAIYFFFVNLEAGKEKNKSIFSETKNKLTDVNSSLELQNLRIKIPVIPYEK